MFAKTNKEKPIQAHWELFKLKKSCSIFKNILNLDENIRILSVCDYPFIWLYFAQKIVYQN